MRRYVPVCAVSLHKFEGVFAKLAEKPIIFVMFVCPRETTGFHWMNFRDSLYCGVVLKSADIIKFWLKSEKNNRHFTRRPKRIVWESVIVPPMLLTIVHWGCHGSEAMDNPFINFTAFHNLIKNYATASQFECITTVQYLLRSETSFILSFFCFNSAI
jgi:hypothetical protein